MDSSSAACEFPNMNPEEPEIARLLQASRTIAVVGVSAKPDRPSHQIALYLQSQGFTVFPVNPGHKTLLGVPAYKSVREVPEKIDIVNLFLRPEAIKVAVDDAIAAKAKAVWMQLGVVDNRAADEARKAGLQVIMDKCIRTEHGRLFPA